MNRPRPILMAIALAILLTEAARFRTAKPTVSAARPVRSWLALDLQRQGRAWRVSWNRNLEAVRDANHAILHIADGTHHTQLELNTGEMMAGKLVYWPETDSVTFRLEAITPTAITTGTVQALGAAPPPKAAQDDSPVERKPSPFALLRQRQRLQKVSVQAASDAPSTPKPAGSFFGRLVHKIPLVQRLQTSGQRTAGSAD